MVTGDVISCFLLDKQPPAFAILSLPGLEVTELFNSSTPKVVLQYALFTPDGIFVTVLEAHVTSNVLFSTLLLQLSVQLLLGTRFALLFL